MDIVCLGQQNWDVCWTGKQQLMTRLVRRGHRVLYIDPRPSLQRKTVPQALKALLPARTLLGLRMVQPNLWVYTHHNFPLAKEGLRRWHYRRSIAGIVHRLRLYRPLAICLHPGQRDIVEGLSLFSRIYFTVDEMTGFAGLSEDQIRQRREDEEHLVRTSDVAIGVSPRLVERFRKLQPRSYLLPNGVDVSHFGQDRLATVDIHPLVRDIPEPRIGYVGYVDHRLDYPLLIELAAKHRAWHFVFIGRINKAKDTIPGFNQFEREPNVHMLGQKDYADLPRFVAGFSVCVAPYVDSILTNSCNPLKVYEYLATGLPVVTSPVDGLAPDVRSAIRLATGTADWDAAISTALAEPEEGKADRLRVARENSWEARVDALEDHLEEAVRLASADPSRAKKRWWSSGRGAERALRLWGGMPPLDSKYYTIWQMRKLAGSYHGLRHKGLYYLTQAIGSLYYLVRIAVRLARGDRPIWVRRILLSRGKALGDGLLMASTCRALQKRYPKVSITVMTRCGSAWPPILQATGHIDQVQYIPHEEAPWWTRLKEVFSLVFEGYDLLIISMPPLFIHRAMYCGAPIRLGAFPSDRMSRLCSHLTLQDPTRHESDNNLAVVESLGTSVTIEERVPQLPIPADVDATWRQVLERFPPLADHPFILIHPGGKRPTRWWPIRNFGQLAERFLLQYTDYHIVLTGTPGEAHLIDGLLEGLTPPLSQRIHNSCGRLSVHELLATIHHARAVVSNDTGIVHLTRMVDRPFLVLLGPENDRRWMPYPLGRSPAIAIRHLVPCAPCDQWICPGHFCMQALKVEEANAALDELMAADAPPVAKNNEGTWRRITHRRRHWRWHSLAAAGHTIPRVALVANIAGKPSDSLKSLLMEFQRAAMDCRYPNFRLFAVAPESSVRDLRSAFEPGTIDILGASGPESAMQALKDVCDFEYVRFWDGEELGNLSDHVSSLYRCTPVMAVKDGAVADLMALVKRLPNQLGGHTIRWQALEILVLQALSSELASPYRSIAAAVRDPA